MKDIHAVLDGVFADAECCADDTLWFDGFSTLFEVVVDAVDSYFFDFILACEIAAAEHAYFWREPLCV